MFSTPQTPSIRSRGREESNVNSVRQLFQLNTTTSRNQRGNEDGEQPIPSVNEGSRSEIVEALGGLQQQVSALQAQVQQSSQPQGGVSTPRGRDSSTISTPKRNSKLPKELVVSFAVIFSIVVIDTVLS